MATTTFRNLRVVVLVCLGNLAWNGHAVAQNAAAPLPTSPPAAAPPTAAAQPPVSAADAPAAKPEAAETKPPKASAGPETPPPSVPAPGVPPQGTPGGSVPAVVGRGGFHPFDKDYVLLGLNTQLSSDYGSILEGEASVVPWISDGLLWLGFWASAGGRLNSDGHDGGFRAGGGLEAGWRFLAADAGYMLDLSKPRGAEGQHESQHGLRFRVGGALALDMGASCARYSRDCCSDTRTLTTCECERIAWGGSLFVYYAHETRPVFENGDGMVGFSFKMGLGL